MAFSKEEIINTLLSTSEDIEGLVMAFNMVHAVNFGVLSSDKVSKFLNDWWNPYLLGEDEDLSYEDLKSSFYTTIYDGESSLKNYLLGSKILRTTTNKEHNMFYSLKEYHKLYAYTLSEGSSANGDILPEPDQEDPESLDQQIELMKENNIFDTYFNISEGQKFSLEHSVYWVCPELDLTSIFKKPDSATRATAFLGLSHFSFNSYVIAVKLPPEYMENDSESNVALRSTPLDAGFHSRFKCLADNKQANCESGYTVDLAKLESNTPNADGGREFVVKESRARAVTNVLLQPLGRVISCPIGDDNEFIQRLEKTGGIKMADIATEFAGLIK